MAPFNKYVKTLDHTKLIIKPDYDSDLEEEEKKVDRNNEKINVNKNNKRNNKR